MQRAIAFLKGFTVFNVEQIDGLPPHFYAQTTQDRDPIQRIAAETYLRATGADIRHGGNTADHNIAQDFVQMPLFESFCDAESTRSH